MRLVVPADKYPKVPNPRIVDWSVESNTGELMSVVDPDERYPIVPSPRTVLVMTLANATLLIKPAWDNPTTVEVNSVGSIKEEIRVCNPIVVELRVLARKGVLTKFTKVER